MFTDSEGTPIEVPDPELGDAETLEVLTAGEVQLIGRMPFSSNGTYLCVVGEGDTAVGAIYKPQAHERPLWDFPEGTLYRREVASFALSDALGWSIVPPTVMRDGAPIGTGSLQRFIVHNPEEHYFTLQGGREDHFRHFAAFDIVANNTDRKGGHCLRSLCTDAIVGIDQGLTFHVAFKLRTVIWEFAGEEISSEIRADLERVAPTLPELLGPTLSPLEIEATAMRIRAFLDAGTFPEPTDDYRSYPWPLV